MTLAFTLGLITGAILGCALGWCLRKLLHRAPVCHDQICGDSGHYESRPPLDVQLPDAPGWTEAVTVKPVDQASRLREMFETKS